MEITITLDRSQIKTDISAECSILARTMNANREDASTDGNIIPSELASYLADPLDDNTKVILARAITKGIDGVKLICSRFVSYGRESDDNKLENISGNFTLHLSMSDKFNTAVTSTIKSYAHSYITNVAMAHILRAQLPDAATNYLAASVADEQQLRRAINARERFSRKASDWS